MSIDIVVPAIPSVGVAIPGLQGPPGGGAGGGNVVELTARADAAVGAETVVMATATGVAVPDLTNPGNVAAILGVTKTAAAAGATVTVIASGTLTEVLWNWAPGPIFCAANGALTQTAPADALVTVGVAVTPTSIQVSLGSRYLRT